MRLPFVSRAEYERVVALADFWQRSAEQANATTTRVWGILADHLEKAPPTPAPVAPAEPTTPDAALLPAPVLAAIAREARGNPALARQLRYEALGMAATGTGAERMVTAILRGDRVTSEDDE